MNNSQNLSLRAKAAQELLNRRKARSNLQDFICYLDPEYVVSDFSREVCAALDQFLIDMAEGLRPVLVLGAPPQHGKSQIVSRYLPAYMFGKYPDLRVGGLSYAKDLASDMNRDVQRIMLGEEYKRLFPASALNQKRVVTVEMEAKRNSDTFEIMGHKGVYVSQGVGGPLTGKRLDCFVAGTMIKTDSGDVPIEAMSKLVGNVRVRSFDGRNPSFGRLLAFREIEAKNILRIVTSCGKEIECTEEHKIYINGSYTEAKKAKPGSRLLCIDEQGVYNSKVIECKPSRKSATVYDIQVEGDSNFFANGVLVHNCGIIDDPIKNSKEALSQTVKDGIWNWYTSTFMTRLSKNSGQIIMATRWATDDLSGKVIEKNPKAKVLAFKAISDDGQALVPELHPIDKLLETKATLGDYFWSAMYQQSPVALGGNLFKTGDWRYYDALPKLQYRKMFADTAQKTNEQNDFSVLQVWGYDGQGAAYLIDQIRGKWEAPDLLTHARAFWRKHKAIEGSALREFAIEDKVSGTGLIQTLKRENVPVKGIKRSTDKVTRAMDVLPTIAAGAVYLPSDAPWLSDFITEAAQFPSGTHDDQIDPMMDAVADMVHGRGPMRISPAALAAAGRR